MKVFLDGRPYIEHDNSHIAGAGSVGIWAKADSETAFDDFRFGAPYGPVGGSALLSRASKALCLIFSSAQYL
jgi:hypothetical protein